MSVTEHIVSAGEYTRTVWLLQSPKPRRLAIFLDAEYYLKRMNVAPILDSLSISAVFVSHVDGMARHQDFTCNPRYADFIAQDVISWARREMPGLTPGGHLICGLSLSGLASSHLALAYPEIFPDAICQSGSFWWNSEWLTKNAHAFAHPHGRFWLSVGERERDKGIFHPPTDLHQEESQLVACENQAKELQRLGATVEFQTFAGGHDLALWKAELPDALDWLLASP